MQERLPSPRKIPKDEWTKTEIGRGATFPEHITPLRAREKTVEQEVAYKELTERAGELCSELFERWPSPWDLSREQLIELVRRYEVELTNIASEARILADSYRGFNVGALVIGYQDMRVPAETEGTEKERYEDRERANPWRILFDANTRPETEDGVVIGGASAKPVGERHSDVRKYCAELYLTDRIDPSRPEYGTPEEKMTKPVAMFIVGEAQVDNDSLKQQPVLTSCKLCRDRFWKKTLSVDDDGNAQTPVFEQDMPVISVDARNPNSRKWQPINALHRFHDELPPNFIEID